MSGLYGIDKPIWPVHPAPLKGELMSSWMVRLAHLNGCRVYPFYSQYFGKDKAIWNRDIDRHAPEWLIDGLSEWTRVSTDIIRTTILRSYESYLFERHNPNGNTKWILPLGIFHRTRKCPGLQYCPICLSEDVVPYFRKEWRLASSTVCQKHGVILHDRCQSCGSPVVFTRVDMHQKNWRARSIDVCSFCGVSLRSAICQDIQPCYEGAEKILKKWSIATERGYIDIGQHRGVYSLLAFEVLHQLCKLLISSNLSRGLPYKSLAERLSVEYVQSLNGVFEHQPIQVRHSTILIAMWLLEDWPERFIEVVRNVKVSGSWLLKDMKGSSIPYWFNSVIIENFYRPNPPFDGGGWTEYKKQKFKKTNF